MRILVVNWQDRLNPNAGGAEVHLHEIFGRLAARGHRVTLLVSGWEDAPEEALVDGMEVIRVGRRHTFPLHVGRAYRRRLSDRSFDLVVEDINKLPLFTPLWTRAPVVALVPHLFGTTAFREASWPVASVVWMAERLLPRVYRRTPFQAISHTTAEDLARRGIDEASIRVIHPGIDHDRYHPGSGPRFQTPTLVHVGRLKRYKGLDIVLRALGMMARSSRPEEAETPAADRGGPPRLVVAGRGDDRARLASVARREGVEARVEFAGFVSEERKVELLRRAWVNVYPSPKEGWGLTNIEAAACGTPTVASDAPGLRESVLDGETGFLVRHDDPGHWAERLERLWTDPGLRERLGEGALRHARRFSWETATDRTEEALLEILDGAGGGAGSGRRGPSERPTGRARAGQDNEEDGDADHRLDATR